MRAEEVQKSHSCQFCGQPADHAPIREMKDRGVNVYFCHSCMAEYLVCKNGYVSSVSLYTQINHNMYRWTVTSSGSGTVWHIIDPGEPGVKKNGRVVLIKFFEPSFDYALPNINPKNINNKLRTWLVFL